MKKLLPAILLSLLVLTLLSVKFYPELKELFAANKNESSVVQDKPQPIDRNNPSEESKVSEEENIEHRDPTKPNKFPFKLNSREEMAKKYPKKFNIVKKMYYSWDYIHTVQGEFIYGHPSAGDMNRVQFSIDFDKTKHRAKLEQLTNDKVIETQNILLLNGMATRQMSNKNIYYKEPVTDNRLHYMGLFNNIIMNSEHYSLIAHNYQDWEFQSGKKFGISVYMIEGTISEDTSESLAGPFTMTVAKDTGILLDLKCYGKSKEVQMSVTVKDIEINQGIPSNTFQLDVSNDEIVSKKDFNLSSVGYVEEDKPGGIDTSGD